MVCISAHEVMKIMPAKVGKTSCRLLGASDITKLVALMHTNKIIAVYN